MSRRRGVGVASLVIAFASPSVAFARPTARLEHERAEAASACPDADRLGALVAERLGYAPFRPDAASSIRTRFSRDGETLRAVVELVDLDGASQGRRELTSEAADCTELAESVVLTVSILLDRPALAVPPAKPQIALEAKEPSTPAAPPPAQSRVRFRVGAGALVGTGFAPGINLGFVLFGGVQSDRWSLDLEGRVDLPAHATYAVGVVSSQLQVVSLVPCLHAGVAFGCLVGGAGAIGTAGSEVNNPRHVTSFYALAGARLGIEVPLAGPFAVRAALDALASLTPTTIAVGNVDTWTTPPAGLAAGAGLLAHFP